MLTFINIKEYFAVHVRRVRFGTADVRAARAVKSLAEHLYRLMQLFAVQLLAYLGLKRHNAVAAVLLYLLVYLIVKIVRGRVLLARVGESA